MHTFSLTPTDRASDRLTRRKNRKLKRDHTLGKLRCVASNNNLTRPAETALRLKMLCKSLLLRQTESRRPSATNEEAP